MSTTQAPTEPRIDKSARRVRSMFASIARRYDFLNHLLSLNIDKSWRRFTTRKVPPESGVPILDCCTGTADLAIEYDRASGGTCPILGTDFCREMLEIGNQKLRKLGAEARVTLVEGDTLSLPVPSDTFGVVTVAFGLRNVGDTSRGLDEMIRVARPGGKVAVLEFSRPTHPLLGRLYLFFFQKVLPRIGQAVMPNQHEAYCYLPATVMEFPDGAELARLMEERGLCEVEFHPLTFGVATLYVGVKPGRVS